jgi:hypothetical protein
MTLFSFFHDRLSAPGPGASQAKPVADAANGERPPFAKYDGLKERQVIEGLSDHTQVELEAAERYERSHQDRKPVLAKLRYLRGREPLQGYDALSIEEIRAALKDADLDTVKKVRTYERKFAGRPDVLEEVVRVHHQRRTDQPKSVAPGYQPLGGALAPSAPVDRLEGGRS